MSDKPAAASSRALLVVLCAGFALFAWFEHRRFERLERTIETLRREPPPAPAVAPAPPSFAALPMAPGTGAPAQMPAIAAPHVDPRQDQSRLLLEAASLTPYQFSAVRKLNDDWGKVVAAARQNGEKSLPRPLAELKREREEALDKLLSLEQRKRFRAFEAAVDAPRTRVAGADGRTYEHVAFE